MSVDYDQHVKAVQHLKDAEGCLEALDLKGMGDRARSSMELDPSLGRAKELAGFHDLIMDSMDSAEDLLRSSIQEKGIFPISDISLKYMASKEWPKGKNDHEMIGRLQLIGSALIGERMWKEAALVYLQIEASIQPSWMIFSVLGLLYRELGNLEPSLVYYDKALGQPDPPKELYHDRGVVLFKMGRFQEAGSEFSRMLEIDPSNPMVWNNLGSVQEALGKDGEAVLSYMKALEIDENYYPALYSMGRVLQKQGKMDEARIFMEKALDIEGRVYDIKDVNTRSSRDEGDDVHVKEIMTKKR